MVRFALIKLEGRIVPQANIVGSDSNSSGCCCDVGCLANFERCVARDHSDLMP